MPGAVRPIRHPPIPVDVRRGSLLESRHVVYGALWGDAGPDRPEGAVVEAWGDADHITTMRSALKPVQVLPALLDGVAARFGLSDEEVALAIGSHSGQEVHMAVLQTFMEKTGLEADQFQCGRHRPFHKDAARQVGAGYSVLHNNCSGKHAAMLAWCLHQDADLDTYRRPEHPLQRRILALTSLLSGVPEREIGVAVDGCGVPTLAIPLGAMARVFWFLARPEAVLATRQGAALEGDAGPALVAALHRVADLMAAHPVMVAGEERPDTDVIAATEGRILTKAGAEGLWCGVDRQTGTGFAFKTVDGNFRACVPATLEVLQAQKVLRGPESAALEKHHRPVTKNHVGDVVGQIVPRL